VVQGRVVDTPAGLLQREREQARALLAEAYAHDWIDQGELDDRLEQLERATTITQLRALTQDIQPVEQAALVPATAPAGPPAKIGALFSAVERGGAWRVPSSSRVRVVFGSATIDLRQAELPPGPIELAVSVWFGSLDIIVPPGWRIDNHCGSVLASVEQDDSTRPPGADARVLRLTGRVVCGSLSVRERLPGEGWNAARKRRRDERKALAERAGRALPRGRDD
jgi:hypothetical protein